MKLEFPYGLADFRALMLEDCVYIDRTDRIPLIEKAGRQLIFLRPRRFGKSLWLSVLENYYDIARADEFEKVFGRLAIGKKPTQKRNSYFILKWDFSVVSPQGDAEQIRQRLHRYLNSRIKTFAAYYESYLDRSEIEIDPEDTAVSFDALLRAINKSGHPLYLLVDEYDNFANEVMMSRQHGARDRYETLLYGEGALKPLFKAVKAAATGMGLERVFITGVSPVAMSDVSSAYNVAKNITHRPELNDLCGFHEHEIAALLRRVVEYCKLSAEEADKAMEMMRVFYDGYRFSTQAKERIYNPVLVIYFLEFLRDYCVYPKEILDENLATDRLKLEYVSSLPGGREILSQVLDIQQPAAVPALAKRFGVADVLNPAQDSTVTASLLYYLGMLTLDANITSDGKTVLTIPNLTVKDLYLERIRELHLPTGKETDEVRRVAEQLYSRGDIQPLCEFIERERMQLFDNRDYASANELTIKTVFLMLLAGNIFYITDSETELERGYADLTLIVRPDMRQHPMLLDILIEFKYVSLKDIGLSGEQAGKKAREELEKLAEVKKKRADAEKKLAEYRAVLEKKHGAALRLRCFSVVAAGFERLLWKAFG
ncbi:MAG: AAA family ATPase [Gammaproteobacteria bacterium]|nr:AAA family ATPase [Gammaproteobacteria bacterium]